MKKKLLLWLVCFMSVVGMSAQASYTFNATALNVDGLPASIVGIEINPGAKEEGGATVICNYLSTSGWDIVGFSEDFNFHSNLVADPASTMYNFGTHGGRVSGLSNSTDGLGLAVSKRLTMSDEAIVKWGNYNGFTDQGADGLITKGYRTYTITFATDVAIDVYVLHMDASDGDADIQARHTQLGKLSTAVINKIKTNKRPAIIMGDTNCRYTRENLKGLFIDVINAESGLTIKDAWIEKVHSGVYPKYPSESMMTHTYGEQRGEIVDKVFYVNTTASNLQLQANSYLHDTRLTPSDHYPVVVNFTLTDANGTPMTDAEKEENWTMDEAAAGAGATIWEGEQVVSGTGYYLMNVATGEYIKYGGAYFTEAVGGKAAALITPESADGTTWTLKTSTARGWTLGDGDYTYTDQAGTWYLDPVEGTAYQYRIRSLRNNYYLTANTSEAHHPIKCEPYNASSEEQKWVFLTDARIRTEMRKAKASKPFNFTPLLKAADFDAIDYEDGFANNWTGFNHANGPFKGASTGWGGDASLYCSYAYSNSTDAVTMSQSLGTLPRGKYDVRFQGFYRAKASSSNRGSAEDRTVSATVTFGSTTMNVKQNTGTAINASVDDVANLFRPGDYTTSSTPELATDQAVTVTVSKPKTSYTQKMEAWICVDNFQLTYYGTGEGDDVEVDYNEPYKKIVRAKVNATYPKVMALNAAGQAAYDISLVNYKYDNDLITNEGEANALCLLVDEAYANALKAHNAAIVSDVLNHGGSDLTGVITNPSFETGDLTGWTRVGSGWDVDVHPNTDATFTTEGCDGDYLFNSYQGDDAHTGFVQQTINGLPNGLYELKALVTAFGPNEGGLAPEATGNSVFLIGNDYHKSYTATTKTQFVEGTLYFMVEDGTATIGAIGGNKANGTEFKYYWPGEGCFFKADNFRLSYVCDVAHGRLKLALDEAKEAKLDAYGKEALNISTFQTMYDSKSLTSDGLAEAAAVRAALQTAAKAQKTVNADMTFAIANPNFETGDISGWTCETGGDTKAAPQENYNYNVAGADGRFVFNTWADGNIGQPLTQTVTGLANGTYKLTAMVASDPEKNISLTANGVTATVATASAKSLGVYPTVTCEVTDGTLAIQVAETSGSWYKADDFRLTYLGHNLVLNETTPASFSDDWYTSVTLTRTIKADKWSTFVVPFDIPAVGDWEVMEFTSAVQNGDNIQLTFEKRDAVKAGVPYMVRYTDTFAAENTNVKAAITPATHNGVTFTGTYTPGTVPVDAFFVNDNKFYRAADGTNKIKAYRGYFTVEGGANINKMSFVFDGDETAIENVEMGADAEVVAIYSLDGRRIEKMQRGINIVKMSDGKTKKVMVK